MKVERQISSSCGVCCIHKKTVNGHLVVKRSNSNVKEVETIHRRRRSDARQAVRSAKCQDFGYALKRSNFTYLSKQPSSGCYGGIRWEEIIAGIMIVMMAFMVPLGLYLVRRYNRTLAYGAGGCVSTAFLTYDDCQILT